MSSTSIVCQGLQSCLEPFLLEPRVLMHQLVPSKHTPQPENPKNDSLNCWNFMQSAPKSIDESEKVYVHPRPTSYLSTKSLEMCTESLGSETGSLVDSTFDEYSHKQSSGIIKEPKKTKKLRHGSSFPPPLTSISGREGVQVQTHREGGRLLIKAFTYSYFQAERQNGRLRLSLIKEGGENDGEEEVDHENVDEEGGDLDWKGGFWGENDGCKEWSSSSRCNDDRCKRLPNLPFWVAIS